MFSWPVMHVLHGLLTVEYVRCYIYNNYGRDAWGQYIRHIEGYMLADYYIKGA